MPAKMDPKKAKTAYAHGVLDVTIPKTKEKKKPRREPIKLKYLSEYNTREIP